MSESACGFSGNLDLCGFGVCLGMYLLWLSTQIAYYFQLDGAKDLSESSQIFSLALTIAIFIHTFRSQDADERAHPVEAVIMLYMIIGGMLSSIGAVKQSPAWRPLWWRLLLLNVTYLAVSVYAGWFWIAGADRGHFQQTSGCGNVMFLFARIPGGAFRHLSVFFALISVYSSISWSIGLLSYYEDLLALIKGKIVPLSPTAKDELLRHINSHCPESLNFLVVHDLELSSSSISPKAYLENITYTSLTIRSEVQEARSIIRLDRPLIDMKDKEKVQKRI